MRCAACLAACTAAPAVGRHVTIDVAPAQSQVDQPVGIKVRGPPPPSSGPACSSF
jgi:hypothetical protein